MKSLKSFFVRIGSWFAEFASPAGQKQLNHVLDNAFDLLNIALPVVETIALATPTKADDEILAMVKVYLPKVTIPFGPISDEEKSSLIRQAAVFELTVRVADKTGIPSSTLNFAIEIAYSAYKATKA